MNYDKIGRFEYKLMVFLVGLAGLSAFLLLWQAIIPQPIRLPGMVIDRLTTMIMLLVAGVGAVAYRFSLRYLDGEPRHRQFMRWLAFTVSMAFLFVPTINLLLLFLTWSFTSIGLHQLLTFYRERPEAYPPARKKFLISRLGDVALLIAIAMIGIGWGTLDLHVFLEQATAAHATSFTPSIIAMLIVIAALTKSAQFPFHSWLPETMEAPTPVSALMHAGIINAGSVLILHFAPLIAMVPLALFNLALVGTITAILGMLAMWAQTNVKRTLAWSTVSQMGFMMIEFGLLAFPVATLHLIGHGFYKAWSFLRSGELPRQPAMAVSVAPARSLLLGLIGTILSVPVLALAAHITGFDPFKSPGELALTSILALSIGQIWIASFRTSLYTASDVLMRGLSAFLIMTVLSIVALTLYHGIEVFLEPVFGHLAISTSPLAWFAAILPVIAFMGLATMHTLLPLFGQTAAGRAFYVHALHGFYLGIIFDRFVDRIWNSFEVRRAEHA